MSRAPTWPHARQRSIIEKLYECDAKQAEDEFTAQLEFAKARIVDSLEKKAAKGSRTRTSWTSMMLTDTTAGAAASTARMPGFALPRSFRLLSKPWP